MSHASLLSWLLGLAALAAAAGCGSEAPDGAADGAGRRVVLGTGFQAFEPLESGGTVPLIKGIQNGFHVWTSFLAYGFEADRLRMELTTRWDGLDESLLEMGGSVGVREVVDPAGEPALGTLGWPASIFNPACAHGKRLHVELRVSDAGGQSASDAREWLVEVAEQDRSSDCAE